MNNLSIKDELKIWGKVALNSFGGPAGQISIIHKILVEDKKLISEEKFLHALNFCMLLPGPEAQQLATYLGWMMSRWRGGLLAGLLFILPGFFSILLLSLIYIEYQNITFVQGLFFGIRPGVIILIFSSLFKISQRTLKTSFNYLIAFLGFISLFFLNIPFPVVVFVSGTVGMVYGKFFIKKNVSLNRSDIYLPDLKITIKTFLIFLFIWILPIFLTYFLLGASSTLHQMNIFFSKMSLVTFGGAYAALSYVAQRAVEFFHWMSPVEMIDGLAMSESTPGPLIQTVQFVGFMGAFRYPDFASPLVSALVASVLTTWMTFAPCFLWIFTFAPYVEYLRDQKFLNDALKAISSAVVGVILNLSIWFMIKTLFNESKIYETFLIRFEFPILSSLDFLAFGLTSFGFVLYQFFKLKPISILGLTTLLGILIKIF